jgi:hypothetical protein
VGPASDFVAGFFRGACLLSVLLCANAASAASSWNGTWVGNWRTDNGAQIIFAGNDLSGLFWDGDYVADAHAALSPDGRVVTITWGGSGAVLTRDGASSAHIVIHEKGRPDAEFTLKRDGG